LLTTNGGERRPVQGRCRSWQPGQTRRILSNICCSVIVSQSCEQAVDVDIALATTTRFEIKFQV